MEEKGWTAAAELKSGDVLYTKDGEIETVSGVEVEKLKEAVKVYNLEVEDSHTYYVSVDRVLVHNKCELNEFDIEPYGEFNKPQHVGDGLTGHELLQNAWLEANAGVRRGDSVSRQNPAIALFEDSMHKMISSLQKQKNLNKKNLQGTSWRSNVKVNIEIMLEVGVPRNKIAELAWKTREFSLLNGL